MKEKILYVTISLLMAAGLLVAVPAFAQTQQGQGGGQGAPSGSWRGAGEQQQRAPGVFGTVTAISGDSITLSSKGFGPNSGSAGGAATATTYTVNATNATVTKSGAASTVSAIAVGDTLMVQGTVSGDSVTATKINDGMPPQAQGKGGATSALSSLHGNGEPVIGGSVTAISGDTLTVTNKSNVTYAVDATSATVIKGNATSSVSAIATGDNVIVQGTVDGTSVTASSVIDQGAAPASSGNSRGAPAMMHSIGGVFGAIGGFIQHVFGFF